MIAYKVTKNLEYEGIALEIGKTYIHEGFHFYKKLEDTGIYYKDTKIIEIEVLGDVIDGDGSSNGEYNTSVTNKFKVIREVPRNEWKSSFSSTIRPVYPMTKKSNVIFKYIYTEQERD